MATTIAKIVFTILFSLAAALAAAWSVKYCTGGAQRMKIRVFVLQFVLGLIIGVISLIFPTATVIYLPILALLVILQIENRRGGKQAIAWWLLAILTCFMIYWGMSESAEAARLAANAAQKAAREAHASEEEIRKAAEYVVPHGGTHWGIMLIMLAANTLIGLGKTVYWNLLEDKSSKRRLKESTASKIRAGASVCTAIIVLVLSIVWMAAYRG